MPAVPRQALILAVRVLAETTPVELVGRYLNVMCPWIGTVPESGGREEFERVFATLVSACPRIPQSVLARFAWIHRLSHGAGVQALLDAASSAGVAIPAFSPVSAAMYGVVEQPDVTEQLATTLSPIQRERVDYLAVSHRPLNAGAAAEAPARIAEHVMSKLHRRATVHIFESEHEIQFWIGEDDLGVLRPDRLALDRRTGRLSVDVLNGRASGYRRLFGDVLFGTPSHFAPFPAIRIDSIADEPDETFDVRDVRGMRSVRAVAAFTANERQPYEVREVPDGGDIMARLRRELAAGRRLIRFQLEAHTDDGTRLLINIGPSVLTYDRLHSDRPIREFLESKAILGFAKTGGAPGAND